MMEGIGNLLGSTRIEVLVAVIAVVVIYAVIQFIKNYDLPPGPTCLPIVGYLPFMTKKPYLKFNELAKKYGDVFSLKIGSQNVVVLNSGKAIRDGLEKPELLGRPEQSIFELVGQKSPFFSSGNFWQEHRRFSLRALRDLGLGKSHLHEHIKDEIEHFMTLVEKEEGKPFDARVLLTPSMSNNISSLTFGDRYEYDNPERKLLDENLDVTIDFLGQTSVYIFMPWVEKLPFIQHFFQYDKIREAILWGENMVKKKINEHKKTFDPNNPRDFIDCYLNEMKTRSEKDPNTYITEKYLPIVVQGLFGAGSETVRTSVGWLLYTMAAYPEVQEKVQQEIDNAIGRERTPEFIDQKHLPYTQSVIMEMARWQTVAPINLLRLALDDTTVKGYRIPKGTIVIANLWAAHNEPGVFKEPRKFVADRFLSADGKTVIKSDNYMPFSYGKRNCPGEGLANVELFLYFTSVLQKFRVSLPKGEVPNFDGDLSITYQKKPHKLCFQTRL